jgi:hypothetical protein
MTIQPERARPIGSPVPGASDVELLRAVASGSEQAFAELRDRYGRAVERVCRSVAGAEGEDCEQEVFARIWRKAALYDPCGVKKLDSVEISATTVAAVLRALGLAWLLARCRCAAARGCCGSAFPATRVSLPPGRQRSDGRFATDRREQPACPTGGVLWSDLEAIAGRTAAGADHARRVASTGSQNLQR